MVVMSDVWDRASAVLARRAGGFAAIALLLVWLPGVVRGLARYWATPTGAVAPVGVGAFGAGLIGLAAAVLAVLGHLALVAQASDPLPTWRGAVAIAVRRFFPYVAIMLPVAIAALVLFLPVGIAIAAAYPNMAAMRAGATPALTPGLAAFVALYSLIAFVVVLWVEARVLSVLVPVVVNERRGFGSYARAFALTRGLAWRILGVVLIFAVLVAVVTLAVRGVAGVALRLMLGVERIDLALLLTSMLVALVVAGAWVVAAAFSARLHAALRDDRAA